jgi:hypothetical protein
MRDNLLTVKGERGGREAESYDHEKTLFSINHTIYFDGNHPGSYETGKSKLG